MANRRRVSKGLCTAEVKEMSEAWHHAARIGRPLNVLISLRPEKIDDLSPEERCLDFRAFRNKASGYARRHGFEPTFVWSREINPDGSGEHMHVLMHVPKRFRQHFEETLIGWFPGPAEME